MPASTVTRTTWTNDTGTPASPVGDGTLINNARLQDIFAAIDQMFSGAGAYATFTFGGKLAVEGFGAHTFSAAGASNNSLQVRNTTSGTGAFASVDAGNNSTATLTRMLALSSGYTSSGYLQASGSVLEANGAGGMSLAATHASGDVRVYTGASVTERMRLTSTGLVGIGIGAATPASDLELRSTLDGLSGGLRITRSDGSYFILNMDDGGGGTAWGTIQAGDGSAFRPIRLNPSGGGVHFANGSAAAPAISFLNDSDTGFYAVDALGNVGFSANGAQILNFGPGAAIIASSRAIGTGTNIGPYLQIGRNTSGGGAAAALQLTRKGGTIDVYWSDNSGNLRVGASNPTEDNTTVSDTSGTVVGTQTSTRATKRAIEAFGDFGGALALILRTPLYRFQYRQGDPDTAHVGIMADESPEFTRYAQTAFDPVNAFGYTAAAIKALAARLTALEAASAARG